MTSPIDLNEEYRKAIRTKSYVEVWTKIHRHLRHSITARSSPSTPTSSRKEEDDAAAAASDARAGSTTCTCSPRFSRYSDLSSYLLKPDNREVLLAAVPNPKLRDIFHDFFDAGEVACNICVSLLVSIDRLRRDHLMIQRLLNDGSSAAGIDCTELSSYPELENPLSSINFNEIHSLHEALLRRLHLARASFNRRARLLRSAKLASGVTLAVAGGVMAVAALAFAAHAAVAVVVVGGPALISPLTAGLWRRLTIVRSGHLERVLAQVEAAARGAYIMNREMEMMSRMAARLQDEVEHRKRVVMLFLRSRERWVLTEAVGGRAGGGEDGHLERQTELEEHIYWSLLTIKRTRALLAQEIMVGATVAPTT